MSPILGPATGIVDLLDYEILEKQKNDEHRYFPLRPSSAGKCCRCLAHELAAYLGQGEYPKDIKEPHVYRLLSLGNSVEYSVLKHLELLHGFKLKYKQQMVKIGFLKPIGEEVPPLIEGSIDVALISDNYKCILDVKSAKDGWSAAYKSRWDETLDKFNQMSSLQRIGDYAYYADDLEALVQELGEDFLVDNLLQVNLYCTTDFARDHGIDHGIVLKSSKNDSRMYEIRFRPSDKLRDEVMDKFQKAYEAAMKGNPNLARRDCKLGTAKAAFSNMKQYCWPEDDALKAWFKTFPKKEWATKSHEVSGAEELFTAYEATQKDLDNREKLEQTIIDMLVAQKVRKIKLTNGNVYDVKLLKSPREHFELRRSKE